MTSHNHVVLEQLRAAGIPMTSESIADLVGITHPEARGACISLEGNGAIRRIVVARDKPLLWECVDTLGVRNPSLSLVYEAVSETIIKGKATQKHGKVTKRDYDAIERLLSALTDFRAYCTGEGGQ